MQQPYDYKIFKLLVEVVPRNDLLAISLATNRQKKFEITVLLLVDVYMLQATIQVYASVISDISGIVLKRI
jgi:polynucleotide 5'-kinase involved in rRNA processing